MPRRFSGARSCQMRLNAGPCAEIVAPEISRSWYSVLEYEHGRVALPPSILSRSPAAAQSMTSQWRSPMRVDEWVQRLFAPGTRPPILTSVPMRYFAEPLRLGRSRARLVASPAEDDALCR
jgi:hypothetical protein